MKQLITTRQSQLPCSGQCGKDLPSSLDTTASEEAEQAELQMHLLRGNVTEISMKSLEMESVVK